MIFFCDSSLNNSMIKRLIFYFPRYFSPLWFFVILMTRNKNCYTQNEFFKNAKLIDYIFHHFLSGKILLSGYVINILFKTKKKRTFNFILQVVKVKYNNSRYNYPTMLIIHDTYPFSRRNQRLFHPMKRVFHWKARVRSFEKWASEIRKPVGFERKLGSWRG